jgi:hypothetical protein
LQLADCPPQGCSNAVHDTSDDRLTIGIIHGDADSLAGWSLAVEAMYVLCSDCWVLTIICA